MGDFEENVRQMSGTTYNLPQRFLAKTKKQPAFMKTGRSLLPAI